MITKEEEYLEKKSILSKLISERDEIQKVIDELDSELEAFKPTRPPFRTPFLDDFLYDFCDYDTYVVPNYEISEEFLDKMIELGYVKKTTSGGYVATEKLRESYSNDEDGFPEVLYKELISNKE